MRSSIAIFWLLLATGTAVRLLSTLDEEGIDSSFSVLILAVVVSVAAVEVARTHKTWPVFVLLGSSLLLLVVVSWSAMIAYDVAAEHSDSALVPLGVFGTLGGAAIFSIVALAQLLLRKHAPPVQ